MSLVYLIAPSTRLLTRCPDIAVLASRHRCACTAVNDQPRLVLKVLNNLREEAIGHDDGIVSPR